MSRIAGPGLFGAIYRTDITLLYRMALDESKAIPSRQRDAASSVLYLVASAIVQLHPALQDRLDSDGRFNTLEIRIGNVLLDLRSKIG